MHQNLKGLIIIEYKCNLEREYRDCIQSGRDKIGITGISDALSAIYCACHVWIFFGGGGGRLYGCGGCEACEACPS